MDLSSHPVFMVMGHCRPGIAPRRNSHQAGKPGCDRSFGSWCCCRVTGYRKTILSLCPPCLSAGSVAKASKDWSCRKQPACPNLFAKWSPNDRPAYQEAHASQLTMARRTGRVHLADLSLR